MKRKALLVIAVLALLAIVSGGTDSVDINRIIFVVGVGVDAADDGYTYTFYTAVPIGSDNAVSENSVEYQSTSISGQSMADAVRKLEKGASRQISFEHLNCAAIGSDMLGRNVREALDYLLRAPSVRQQCTVLGLTVSAKEFFSVEYNGSIASAAASLVERQDDSDNRSSIMTLGRLDTAISINEGYFLYLTGISAQQGEASASDASADSFELAGMAVYNSGGLGGVLDAEDAELARLFTHGQASGLITSAEQDGCSYFYEVTYSGCDISFVPGDPCRANVDITVECILIDSSGSRQPAPSDSEMSAHLRSMLLELVELSREYGSAVTGIETEARQSARLWFDGIEENWDSLYRSAEIDLMVRFTTEQRSLA